MFFSHMLEKSLLKQLRPEENVLFIVREYIITKFFIFTILLLAYFCLLFFMYPLISYGVLTTGLFFIALVAILFYSIRTFIIWYLDVMIVTADRLIDIERSGIFSYEVKDIDWENIRDITYKKQGVWAILFNYGTIRIAIADQDNPIELDHVYQPHQIRDILSNHVKKTNQR